MFALGTFLARVGAPAQATANTTSTTKREGKERPAKLLRKTILTEGSEGSFAVYTGTFQVPDEGDDLGVRIGFMDSIKVMVPVSVCNVLLATKRSADVCLPRERACNSTAVRHHHLPRLHVAHTPDLNHLPSLR